MSVTCQKKKHLRTSQNGVILCFVFPGITFSKIHLIVILEMSVWASQAQVRDSGLDVRDGNNLHDF